MGLNKQIILIGFMGTGKSSVGKVLAESLNIAFYDADIELLNEEQKSISDIFAQFGEDYFREVETKILKKLINNSPGVVASGGGIVLRRENRDLLKNHFVILLEASSIEICQRIKNDNHRPLLRTDNLLERIDNMLRQRKKFYQQSADLIINTNNKTINEIIKEIIPNLPSE